ncbi:Alpha-1,3-mannosyl-glycoprotein 2-beta-N-acetylglucosaminyltransferase [Sesamum angolense]|uniref:Alpha-1,3-mannosyl-glycoprotein 2-beta-N-acetylglucosaminyltransferase n=1 Tax=Sesamum angolense TaxID=2727404 RepID=A0AAE1WY04_9LAMI|nr:Alpha-1,3-mannosyl-glycoprotein 2-beta-N-acetylglucosaminyltransferase [Sesamum angolense]
MRKCYCDYRYLLLIAAIPFIYIQMRLFATQSQYADRLADAYVHIGVAHFEIIHLMNFYPSLIEAENQCTKQTRFLIDQISMQKGQILSLEEERKRQDEECRQLRALVQDLERKGLKKLVGDVQVPVAAVVVMACNRADYLERTIKSILKYQSPVASRYPLFVSQDGSNPHVKSKALSYDQLTYMQHLDYEPVHTERPGEVIAYYKIARHYKWALDQLFYKHKFSRVIILEDDMEIAPDFFDYFEAGAALLDRDKSIMAISSWNDNGQKQFVHDPSLRVYHDNLGSSMGQFFKQYLEPIKLNDVQVDWKAMDLSYLEEDKYVEHFANLLKKATPVIGTDAILKTYNIDGDVRILYRDQSDFEYIASQFGIFEEWKDGVPRTAYKGVVVFRYQTQRRVFLVGPDSLQQIGIR